MYILGIMYKLYEYPRYKKKIFRSINRNIKKGIINNRNRGEE